MTRRYGVGREMHIAKAQVEKGTLPRTGRERYSAKREVEKDTTEEREEKERLLKGR